MSAQNADDVGDAYEADAELSDLTPRSREAAPRRGAIATLLTGAVVLALGAVVVIFLRNASLSVYEADQAVANRTELGTDRFRLIGSPVEGSIVSYEGAGAETGEEAIAFTVVFAGVNADVFFVGPEPSELFVPGVPVFLEGNWEQGTPPGVDGFANGANDGYYFLGDELRVKHDNDYRNDNEERLNDAEVGGLQ
ncbi:MAG: hypothetical protein HKN26_02000 [Acidimicrobiales bacterium]|nr:hypothetical protein [Acidimicrobiales bacterium]